MTILDAFQRATSLSDEGALRQFLNDDASLAQQGLPGMRGMTALMVAADQEDGRALDLLLPYSHPNQQDAQGRTALMLAVARRRKDNTRKLLASTDLTLQDHQGYNALSIALSTGDPSMIDMVWPATAAVVPPDDPAWSITLVVAAHDGLVGWIERCTRYVDTNVPDGRGFLALEVAVEQNHEEAVKCLLHHGADPSLLGAHEIPPLAVAIDQENMPIVRLLLPRTDWSNPVFRSILDVAMQIRATEIVDLLVPLVPRDQLEKAVAKYTGGSHRPFWDTRLEAWRTRLAATM